jgi:hypothetical protein
VKRFYRALLCLLPSSFRKKYGQEMEAAFLETCTVRRGFAGWMTPILAVVDIVQTRWLLFRSSRRNLRPRTPSRRTHRMELLLSDVQYALRSLRKRWTITLLALATLAMGIGATTAVFSVVNGVLLESLPYRDGERIVIIWHDMGNGAQSLPALNQLDYLDYRERSELFEDWTIATGRQ